MTGVMRRKLGAGVQAQETDDGPIAPDRALRLALGRAAQSEMALALIVAALREDTRSLAEVLELTEPGMFLGVLEGRGDALGLMALGQPVLSGVIEHLTTGEIADTPQPARKPTRIDAAMAMPLIDRVLVELEQALAAGADGQDWARGYRYASHLDDPRPLGLLLEDRRYRVFRADVALGAVARAGQIVLALPAETVLEGRRGRTDARAAAPAFAATLRASVLEAPARLEAVLTRVRLPLQDVSGWAPGALVPLPLARPGDMTLEAPRGRIVAQVRLGQCAGARAVRLVRDGAPGLPDAAGPGPALPDPAPTSPPVAPPPASARTG
jgi:flagellar motor switch protein FliM